MRNVRWSMATSGLAVFGALGWVMGCSANSQEDLTDPKFGRPNTTGMGGEGGQLPTSSSSGNGGAAPGCAPEDPTFVSEMCGVFVALAGKADAAGTMTDPLPSLGEGIDAAVASNRYVFVCAETFNEQVTIRNGIAIYGGREDCTKSWTLKADGATTVNGPVDTIALLIETPLRVTLENVDVMAPVATTTSKSSIAVQVSLAEAEFKNCKFTSQDAFKGDDGAMVPSDAALNGTLGSPGKAVCTAGLHPGGVASVKICGGGTSTGGKGGDGAPFGAMSGANGSDGTLSGAAGIGLHGNGQTTALTCTAGGDGSDGSNGADGAGATGIGSISAMGVYTGTSGGTGGTGTPGIGGGGGGSSKGTSVPIDTACNTSDPTDYYGASGGSGGSGGCGGKPGNAGGPGGSSIALLALNAKSVKLDTVTLTPGQGGKGGKGGSGQAGGSQGQAGAGGDSTNGGSLKVGCAGGAGGNGGKGGPGGGGQGGHALGLAFKGTMPEGTPIFPQAMPKPGDGGDAGAGAKDPNVGKGVAGNSTAPASYILEFK